MVSELKPVFVINIPEAEILDPGTVYISGVYKTAIHLCCCGCGDQVVTPFGDGGWNLTIDDASRCVTFEPSILQRSCGSHYFIRRNKVEWVGK